MWFKHRDKTLGINLDLVKDQRITFEELCEIVSLQKERADLFQILWDNDTDNKKFLKIIFNQLTQIEYELQMLWGFEPNSVHHKSWRWPHCTCPYHDNQDAYPYMTWRDIKCPFHGDEIEQKTKTKKHVTSKSI